MSNFIDKNSILIAYHFYYSLSIIELSDKPVIPTKILFIKKTYGKKRTKGVTI